MKERERINQQLSQSKLKSKCHIMGQVRLALLLMSVGRLGSATYLGIISSVKLTRHIWRILSIYSV